ncbi:hypothetical protein [Actinokineospora bangkokensis]|uniref:Uncharacterized protein n=1 Tax=Actinokineospora bangkokensis TaxID=1193682 RepID=A0A1Q9LJM1_9PSEU|nr:hypothetical protein [Actinokineospora bangkokensis]OLR92179.1 hypothetical protein BJP25_22880 [Actinokineospora bangkokensis]
MSDLNTPERTALSGIPPRSAGTALPQFPPRPEDTSPGQPLILSALPAELPESLRRAARPVPVAVPLAAGGEPDRPRSRWRRWAVIGVAAAAVLGGGTWLVLPGDDPAPAPVDQVAPARPAGEYDFIRLPETKEAIRDSDCASHAYGRTQEFLTATPCLQLTRAMFATRLPDQRVVYTSVAVLRMRGEKTAESLVDLVRTEGTGSVRDLVREGFVRAPGLDRLSRGGFAASRNGVNVVIVESDTAQADPDPELHEAAMKRISLDAVRLASEVV